MSIKYRHPMVNQSLNFRHRSAASGRRLVVAPVLGRGCYRRSGRTGAIDYGWRAGASDG